MGADRFIGNSGDRRPVDRKERVSKLTTKMNFNPVTSWLTAGGLAALLLYHFYAVHEGYDRGYDKAMAEHSKALDEARDRYDKWIDKNKGALENYEKENEFLRSLDSSIPIRVVRLSIPKGTGGSEVSGADGKGSNSGSAAGGSSADGVGPDIGPRIYALAHKVEHWLAECRRLNNQIPDGSE